MFQASFPEYDFSYEAGPIQEFHSQRKHGTPKKENPLPPHCGVGWTAEISV